MAFRRPPKKQYKIERKNFEPNGLQKPSFYYLINWDGTDCFDLKRVDFHNFHITNCATLPDGAANLIFSSLK